jgi:hypothetical protein
MPTLRPAGPWRFEAAVTITECNEQSVTNWLQFAQIADYARLTACGRHDLVARRSARSGAACWALWLLGCVSSGLALPVIFPASKDHSWYRKEDTRHWRAAGRCSA